PPAAAIVGSETPTPRPPLPRSGPMNPAYPNRGSGGSGRLLSGPDILATPPNRRPFRVLADPLRDVRLRGNSALPDRAVPGELKVLFVAKVHLRCRTNGDDQCDQSHGHLPPTDFKVPSSPG